MTELEKWAYNNSWRRIPRGGNWVRIFPYEFRIVTPDELNKIFIDDTKEKNQKEV